MTDYTTRDLVPAPSLTETYFRTLTKMIEIQTSASQSLLRQSAEIASLGAEQAATFVRQTDESMRHFRNAIRQFAVQQATALTSELLENAEQVAREVDRSTDISRAAAQRTSETVQQAASGFHGSPAAVHPA